MFALIGCKGQKERGREEGRRRRRGRKRERDEKERQVFITQNKERCPGMGAWPGLTSIESTAWSVQGGLYMDTLFSQWCISGV